MTDEDPDEVLARPPRPPIRYRPRWSGIAAVLGYLLLVFVVARRSVMAAEIMVAVVFVVLFILVMWSLRRGRRVSRDGDAYAGDGGGDGGWDSDESDGSSDGDGGLDGGGLDGGGFDGGGFGGDGGGGGD